MILAKISKRFFKLHLWKDTIFKNCSNWICSIIMDYLFHMNFLTFWHWKIVKIESFNNFSFCQVENCKKIMFWVWRDFGVKLKKYNWGPKNHGSPFWMKNDSVGKKIKERKKNSLNFSTYKTFKNWFQLIELENLELFILI